MLLSLWQRPWRITNWQLFRWRAPRLLGSFAVRPLGGSSSAPSMVSPSARRSVRRVVVVAPPGESGRKARSFSRRFGEWVFLAAATGKRRPPREKHGLRSPLTPAVVAAKTRQRRARAAFPVIAPPTDRRVGRARDAFYALTCPPRQAINEIIVRVRTCYAGQDAPAVSAVALPIEHEKATFSSCARTASEEQAVRLEVANPSRFRSPRQVYD